jgi:hypothetical protein
MGFPFLNWQKGSRCLPARICRRRSLWLGAGLLLVLSAAMILSILLTEIAGFSAYDRIKKGMTTADVLAILGPASDDKAFLIPVMGVGPPPPRFHTDLPDFADLLSASWKNWIRGEFTLEVIFNSDGLVIGKGIIEYPERASMIKRWIRLLLFDVD